MSRIAQRHTATFLSEDTVSLSIDLILLIPDLNMELLKSLYVDLFCSEYILMI